MNKTLFSAVTFVLFHVSLPSKAQLLQGGKYVGYEKIDVREVGEGQVRYWPGMNMPFAPQSVGNELWFHQVTIAIHQDSVLIEKVPVVVKDGYITYSDSLGGFFIYKGEVSRQKNSSIYIYGYLTKRKYTGVGHSNHANPFYMTVSYKDVTTEGKKLVAQATNLGKLVFRKVE